MENSGDPAYNPGFEFSVPDGTNVGKPLADYPSTFPEDFIRNTKITCKQSQVDKAGTEQSDTINLDAKVHCELSKPLPKTKGSPISITVPLDFSNSNRHTWSNQEIKLTSTTKSNQEQPAIQTLKTKINLNTPITVNFKKSLENYYVGNGEEGMLNGNTNGLDDIGKHDLKYDIWINNDGQSEIDEFEVFFKYPYKYGNSEEDRTLLYIYDEEINAQYLNSYEGYNNKKHSCSLVNDQGGTENLHIDAFEIAKKRSKRQVEEEDPNNSVNIGAKSNNKCNKLSKGQVVEKINCDDDCISCLTVKCKVPFLSPRQHANIRLSFRVVESTIRTEFKNIPTILLETSAGISPSSDYIKLDISGDRMRVELPINNESYADSGKDKAIWLLGALLVALIAYLVLVWLCKNKMFRDQRRHQKTYTVSDLEAKNPGVRKSLKREASQYQQNKSDGGEDKGGESAVLIK